LSFEIVPALGVSPRCGENYRNLENQGWEPILVARTDAEVKVAHDLHSSLDDEIVESLENVSFAQSRSLNSTSLQDVLLYPTIAERDATQWT